MTITQFAELNASDANQAWTENKCPECNTFPGHKVTCTRIDFKAALAPEKRGHTILIQVRIESPEDASAITPGKLEHEIKSAIMRSNRIIDAIEIDKIEVEADLNYTEAA